ncbi:hypothetical protein GBA52_014570 [Prunus armeniaca]|nr:hypothetical protein GBA52_014570 [Prunus armeniaca]
MKLAIVRFTTRHIAGHHENSNIPLTTRAHAIHTVKLDGFCYRRTQLELFVELKDVITKKRSSRTQLQLETKFRDVFSK